MTAIGFTSGDPQKVDVAGDTMTGDLVLAGAGTDLTVGGVITDTYGGVTGDVMRLLSTAVSTGITSGGNMSINVNPALIDISATSGWVLDYDPFGTISATNPKMTFVNFAGQAGIALTGPPAQFTTFWLISSTGTVIQQAAPPSPTQYRTHLVLGVSAQFGGINTITRNLAVVQGQTGVQLVDLMRGLGSFVTGGQSNVFSANGANLRINNSGGSLFAAPLGLPNYNDPNSTATTAQAPANFRRVTGTTVLAPVVNTIDAANYDLGGLGVVTPVGGGANTTTVFRIYVAGLPTVNDQIAIQYGQTTFASLAAATAAIGSGNYVLNPTLVGLPLAGYLAVIRTATDLSDPTQAAFTRAGKFANP